MIPVAFQLVHIRQLSREHQEGKSLLPDAVITIDVLGWHFAQPPRLA